MDRLIYTALSALRSQTAAQAVTANNLANAQTPGFRRELSTVAARWLEAGDATRAQADDVVRTAMLDAGPVTVTGATTDIAVDGAGWIAVQPADGAEVYTRRGDLRVSAAGILENGDGDAVLGGAGPLAVPTNAALTIAADGSVSANGVLAGRIKLVSGDAMTKRGDGRFTAAAPLDADPAVRVRSGALEGSNVSTAASLAELIEQSRAFDTGTRLLKMTREIDEGGARLMRLDN